MVREWKFLFIYFFGNVPLEELNVPGTAGAITKAK